MKLITNLVLAISTTFALGACGADSGPGPERAEAPAERGLSDDDRAAIHGQMEGQDHQARFDAADTDDDGMLSKAELEACEPPGPMLAEHFAEIDANGDGLVTHEEIAAAMGHHHPHEED